MSNTNLISDQGSAVYVIDLSSARNHSVSVNQTKKATWTMHTNVLMPIGQILDLTIAEQESKSLELAGLIQRAYGSGLWPDQLSESKILATKLGGLQQLQNGSEKRSIEGDASFAMLLSMHERFVASAAQVMRLARAGKVEEAYCVLTGQYARANRQVVWLLKNLKRRMGSSRSESTPALA